MGRNQRHNLHSFDCIILQNKIVLYVSLNDLILGGGLRNLFGLVTTRILHVLDQTFDGTVHRYNPLPQFLHSTRIKTCLFK